MERCGRIPTSLKTRRKSDSDNARAMDRLIAFFQGKLKLHPLLAEWLPILACGLGIALAIACVEGFGWTVSRLEHLRYERMKPEINAWLYESCRISRLHSNSDLYLKELYEEAVRRDPSVAGKPAPPAGAACRKGNTACAFDGRDWKCGFEEDAAGDGFAPNKNAGWLSGSFTTEDNRGLWLVEVLTEFWEERLGKERGNLAAILGMISMFAIVGTLVFAIHVWQAMDELDREAEREAETAAMNAWLFEKCRAAELIDNSPATIRSMFGDAAERKPALLKKVPPPAGSACRKGRVECVFEKNGWKCAAVREQSPYEGNFRMAKPEPLE